MTVPAGVFFTGLSHSDESPNNRVVDIEGAFARIQRDGVNASLELLDPINRRTDLNEAHIQAIAACGLPAGNGSEVRDCVIANWSRRPSGSMVSGPREGEAFRAVHQLYVSAPSPGAERMDAERPGGIQILGDVLAVPVERVAGSPAPWLVFYRVQGDGSMEPMDHLATQLRSSAASTAGLVRFKDRYVAAVGYGDRSVDFYVYKGGDNLYDPGGKFVHNGTFDEGKAIRHGWRPNEEWRGIEGGGALFAHADLQLDSGPALEPAIYLVTFNREGANSMSPGPDWACLYRVEYDPVQSNGEVQMTKLAELRLAFQGDLRFGPHCNWGAGINASPSGDALSIVVISRGTSAPGKEQLVENALFSCCPTTA